MTELTEDDITFYDSLIEGKNALVILGNVENLRRTRQQILQALQENPKLHEELNYYQETIGRMEKTITEVNRMVEDSLVRLTDIETKYQSLKQLEKVVRDKITAIQNGEEYYHDTPKQWWIDELQQLLGDEKPEVQT